MLTKAFGPDPTNTGRICGNSAAALECRQVELIANARKMAAVAVQFEAESRIKEEVPSSLVFPMLRSVNYFQRSYSDLKLRPRVSLGALFLCLVSATFAASPWQIIKID